MDDIKFNHWVDVVVYLFNHKFDRQVFLTDLSFDLRITHHNVTIIVQSLESRLIVSSVRSGRKKFVKLTPKGLLLGEYLSKCKPLLS